MKDRKFKTQAEMLQFMMANPAAYHAVILHDNDCSPSVCHCEPEYILQDMTPENVIAGAEGESAWRKQTAS